MIGIMKQNKAVWLGICLVACMAVFSCATAPMMEGLMSMDEAIDAAVVEIEARVADGSEITVAAITAPTDKISNFLAEELAARINTRGKLTVLARETALNALSAEQEFQMSGLVSDESAVGIGHFLGAKAVVSGSFDRYRDFSQLRLRTVDAETSELAASFTARIRNSDQVLVNLTASLRNSRAVAVSEEALEWLNRGKDFRAKGLLDDAIYSFGRAITANRKFVDAYLGRGEAYTWRRATADLAIADFTQTIKLDPDNSNAYYGRGWVYLLFKDDEDRAIAEFSQAIRLESNNANYYSGRATAYVEKDDYPRAIADYDQAIRLKPNDVAYYSYRADVHKKRGDYDQAVADYTQAIRLEPDNAFYYYQRGMAYEEKGSYEMAIADYTQAIRLKPDNAFYYFLRASVYDEKSDYERAIADYTQAIRLEPDYSGRYYFLRAEAYEAMGDYVRAKMDRAEALLHNAQPPLPPLPPELEGW
jgi:tetratricopeptide (TPR) repeat protein